MDLYQPMIYCTSYKHSSKLYTLHYIIYTLYSTLYTLHSILYTLYYTIILYCADWIIANRTTMEL